MKRLWLVLTLSALLGACANIPVEEPTDSGISWLPGPAIDEARALSRKGHWDQAITLLEQAGRQYPENLPLRAELENLQQAWALERRLIEDRILVTEVAALEEKIVLLERLYQAEPNNVLYQSRLAFWRQHYQSREESLLACGRFHADTHPRLAKQCLKQAIKIQPSQETAKLLDDTYKRIENRKRASVEKKEVRNTRKTKQEVGHLLEEAEKDIRRGAYGDAMSKLDKAAREDPDNPKVRQLQSETRSILDKRVTTMVRLGDQLYREEKLVNAVAVWEAALELDPERKEISVKIDRARRVMEKLEAIRARDQHPDITM